MSRRPRCIPAATLAHLGPQLDCEPPWIATIRAFHGRRRRTLFEHHFLLLRERDVRRHVIAARRHHERALFKAIIAAVPPQREAWVPRLLTVIEGDEITHLEWLSAVPSSKATKGLEEQTEEVGFLKELGAARLVLPDLPFAGLEHFSRRMTSRKPAA